MFPTDFSFQPAGLTDVMSSIEVVATQPSHSSIMSSLLPSQIQVESLSKEQMPRPSLQHLTKQNREDVSVS